LLLLTESTKTRKQYLVQHGVNKQTITNGAKAWNTVLLTFDFRFAVVACLMGEGKISTNDLETLETEIVLFRLLWYCLYQHPHLENLKSTYFLPVT
jgi:hypothetical protein